MPVLVIGGTPGTGKSKVAKILGSKMAVEIVNLGDLADRNGCISAQDKARDTGIVDEDCLVEALLELVDDKSRKIIIEGHYIDLVPSDSVEIVIVLRTHPETLRERLKERGYSEAKIRENVEAEVLGVCQLDALDAFGEEIVYEIDTTGMSSTEVVTTIEELLETEPEPARIDWMSELEEEGRLDEFLQD
ncbi:MAG: adenylate kinase family protein [Candidatus Thorarchaeota archaeon]|nr:adenylate kinase family protein [Candidatus Thorarchaeota archaeon]